MCLFFVCYVSIFILSPFSSGPPFWTLNACHIIHSATFFIYCSAPLTFASYVMSRVWQDIPSYYFYSLFFLLIFISISFSPSLYHPLPHQSTFSIMTTCKVIELQPTSRYLSFTLRFPCGIVVRRHGEQKKGRG
jgi:hypothetical protein